jgi:hypothetical protein
MAYKTKDLGKYQYAVLKAFLHNYPYVKDSNEGIINYLLHYFKIYEDIRLSGKYNMITDIYFYAHKFEIKSLIPFIQQNYLSLSAINEIINDIAKKGANK